MDPRKVVRKLCLRPENQSFVQEFIKNNEVKINDLRSYEFVPPFLLQVLDRNPTFLHTAIYDHIDNLSILLEKEKLPEKDAFIEIWKRSHHERDVMKTNNPKLISLYLETFQRVHSFPPEDIVPLLTDKAIQLLSQHGLRMSTSDNRLISLEVADTFHPDKFELYAEHLCYDDLILKHIKENNDVETFQKCIGTKDYIVEQCITHYFIHKKPNLEPFLSQISKDIIYRALLRAGKDNTLFDVETAIEKEFFSPTQTSAVITKFELNPLKYKDKYDVSNASHSQLEKLSEEERIEYLHYIMNHPNFTLMRYNPIYRLVETHDLVVLLHNPSLVEKLEYKVKDIMQPPTYEGNMEELIKYCLRIYDPNFPLFKSDLFTEEMRYKQLNQLHYLFNKKGFLEAFLLLQKYGHTNHFWY